MDDRIRVLLVEDDQVDRMAFERFVELEGLPYDLEHTRSVSETRSVLDGEPFDVVIMDYWLGDGTALDLFDEVREAPVIVMTGSGGEEIAVETMKAGAADYLIKDLSSNYLKTVPVTVERAIRRQRIEQELRQHRENLEDLVAQRTTELTRANELLSNEIAERQRAADALRKSEQRYRLLAEHATDMISKHSPDGTYLYASPACQALLGYGPEELIGRDLYELIHPDDRAESRKSHDSITERPVVSTVRYRIRHKDGHYVWFETAAKTVRESETDAVKEIVAVSRDVTEQRLALLQLQEAERRFRTLLDDVRLVAVGLDRDGNVTYVNPYFLEITGTTLDDAMGANWFQAFIPDRERPVLGTVFVETLSGGIEPYYENPILTRTGEERMIAWNNTVLLDTDGEPVGLMSIGEDITERRQAEEALRRSRSDLERSHRALAERVAELEALHSVGVAMSSELDTETLLQLIVEQASALVDAASCSVLLLDADAGELVFRAAVDRAFGMRIPAGHGIVGRVLQTRVPQIVHDVMADPDHDLTIGQETDVPTRSMLAVPLLVGDRAVGVLAAINKRQGRFTEADRDLLVTMASHAAVAIETARLYERAQQEIAERKRAEEALCVSEERLKLALEGANDGLWDWNVVTGDVYFSPRWQAMLGFELGEMEGRVEAWRELVHPDDREKMLGAWNEHLEGRTPYYATEYRARTKFGEWVWILDRGRVVEQDDSGNPLRAVGTQTDITERMQAEEALRIRDCAIESSINAISISDLEGNLTTVNRSFLEIFGYDNASDVLGRPIAEFCQTKQKATDIVRTLRETGHWRGEFVASRRDGTIFPVIAATSIVTDTAGKPVGMMFSLLDITERKRADRLLQTLNVASLAMQRALTPAEIFVAVAEEIKKLGFDCVVFRLDDDQDRLVTEYFSYGSEATKIVEKLMETRSDGFSVPVESVDVFSQVVREKRTVFVEDAEEATLELLPKPLKGVAGQIVDALHVPKSIDAPLIVEDEVIGLLAVQADDLTEGDVPAITAFSHQMAAAWRKAQLFEQAQQEIAERKRAEAERVQAETSLRESEERYRAVVEDQTELICRLLPDLVLNFVNSAYCQYFGKRYEDLIGHSFLPLIVEDDRTRAVELLHSLSPENPVVTFEERVVASGGRTRWQQWTVRAILDDQGQIAEYQGVGRDITERKMAEDALQRYAERLRTLRAIDGAILAAWSSEEIAQATLRHIRELVPCRVAGIVMFDAETGEGTLSALHASGEVGLEAGMCFSLTGPAMEALQHGQVLVQADSSASSSVQGSGGSELGVHRRRPVPPAQAMRSAGVRAYMAVPLIAKGELIGTLALGAETPGAFTPEHMDIAREVTNQLAVALYQARLHEQIEHHVIELERRVAERTSDLSAANAELARAARLKDEFLASMSHELRTPLNAILGLSEALQEQVYGPLNKRQLKSLRNVEASGRHLLSLINDILDVSKIEAGKVELEIGPVSVESVCRACLSLIRQAALKKWLKVSSSFDSAVSTIQADPRRLKQMLVNLLSNAVKFTPEGGAVGLEVVGDPEAQVVHFTVWDTGIGIAFQDMQRLFKPFVQLDSSLSRQHAGTGLGLVLVHRMAEMHGGGVSVESKVDQGSRFTISLPWGESIVGPDRESPQVAESVGGAQRGSEETLCAPDPPHAVIVEDWTFSADNLVRCLAEVHAGAVVHPRGEGAVDRAVEVSPDVIILDIMLPDVSGWEVLAQLKRDARTRDVPVLVVSAAGDRQRGKALGAAGHLIKPVSCQMIREVLEQNLPNGIQATTALVVVSEQVKAQGVVPSHDDRRLILLAEDNEDNISTISDYLLAKGYWVIVARNGVEAVERAKEERPDLILMDIQMPEMDGLEATRCIRADADLAAVPIVALTALAMVGDRERCLEAGVNEYLSKPVSLRRLSGAIEAHLV